MKFMGLLSRCMLSLLTLCVLTLTAAQSIAQPASTSPSGAAAGKKKTSNTGPDPIARRIKQLSDELRSPFCPGKTLMTCTSSQAYDLRKDMEAMAREGKSNKEIIAELKIKYGNDVSNPSQPWYTFFVPFLPFIVLGGLLFWVVRRWRNRGEEQEVGSADLGTAMNTNGVDSLDAAENSTDTENDAERLAKLRARMWQDD